MLRRARKGIKGSESSENQNSLTWPPVLRQDVAHSGEHGNLQTSAWGLLLILEAVGDSRVVGLLHGIGAETAADGLGLFRDCDQAIQVRRVWGIESSGFQARKQGHFLGERHRSCSGFVLLRDASVLELDLASALEVLEHCGVCGSIRLPEL